MKTALTWLTLVTLLLGAGASVAGDSEDAAKAQARRVQQTQRKLEQEKAHLQEEKTGLETKLKETGSELEKARQATSRASSQSATLAKKLKAVEDEQAQLQSKLAETQQQLADQSKGRMTAEAESKRLAAALAAQEKATATCQDKNALLYRYGQEMARRFENKGFLDAVGQAEPLTGLKQVQIENILQEYADKLENERIDTAAPPPAGSR